jgi:hypothetical protein
MNKFSDRLFAKLAQMKHRNPYFGPGFDPRHLHQKQNGGVTASTELASGVDGQRWRGAIRHANVTATKNGKVIAFPAPAVMAMAAAA